MSRRRQSWRVEVGTPEEGERIDRLLARKLRFLSRTQLQDALRQSRVLVYADWTQASVPERVRRPSTRVRAGQLVVAEIDAPFAIDQPTADLPMLSEEQILYEDEHLLAVDKPAGCAVHPSRRHPSASLIEQLHRYQAVHGDNDMATPCHRLDRATSGVVLFAKTASARSAMGEKLEGHHPDVIRKRYLAVVRGRPTPEEGTIEEPIGPDVHSSIPVRQWIDPRGKSARTHYRTLNTADSAAVRSPEHRAERSLLELVPTTGRQHQLRVHLAAAGHPILGDALYGADEALFLRSAKGQVTPTDLERLGSDRLALHAESLSFEHPGTNQPLTIESPLPATLVNLANNSISD